MADFQDYVPTERFNNVQMLLDNHYRFIIDGLPDLSFFVTDVTLPEVLASTSQRQPTPFVSIPFVADHLTFMPLQINFLVDVKFKTYYSLFYWLRGYGFP